MSIGPFRAAYNKSATLLDVEAIRVYYLSERRNAWYGYPSHQYVISEALFETKLASELAANKRRVQGTRFLIRQLPGLRLWTAETSFVLTSMSASEPFSRVGISAKEGLASIVLRPDAPMSTVLPFFLTPPAASESGWDSVVDWGSHREGEVHLHVTTESESGTPMRAYQSFVDGRYMGFRQEACAFRPDSVLRLAKIFDRNTRSSGSDCRARLIDAKRAHAA